MDYELEGRTCLVTGASSGIGAGIVRLFSDQAAKVIADCLDRCRVFLRSRLEESVVEEIGLAPLHDPQELQRLVDRAASCLVIGSAQHAGVQLKQTVEAS